MFDGVFVRCHCLEVMKTRSLYVLIPFRRFHLEDSVFNAYCLCWTRGAQISVCTLDKFIQSCWRFVPWTAKYGFMHALSTTHLQCVLHKLPSKCRVIEMVASVGGEVFSALVFFDSFRCKYFPPTFSHTTYMHASCERIYVRCCHPASDAPEPNINWTVTVVMSH